MSDNAIDILVVEDDRFTRANLRDILELDGYAVRTVGSMREAQAMPDWNRSAVVLLDRRLPDSLAEEMLPQLTAAAPDSMFIIVTGHHDIASAIACLRQGAEDYILKPLNADALRASIRRALNRRREKAALREAEERLQRTLEELEDRVEERTAELAGANRELLILKNLAIAIASQPNLDLALHSTLQQICEATAWDVGEAWLAEEGSSRLRRRVEFLKDESLEPFRESGADVFEFGRGLPGKVWAGREPIWLSNLTDPGTFSRFKQARLCGLSAGLGVPIFSGEEFVAAMTFFMRAGEAEDPSLVDLVKAAVAPLGPVIQRKRIEDELARHKTQLEALVAERTAQLRQADRLASIGTLAAGLGHDMHNVLLPVRSRLDVLEAQCAASGGASGAYGASGASGGSGGPRDQIAAIRRAVTYLQELSDGLHLLSLDPSDDEAAPGGGTTNLAEWWSQVGSLLAKTLPKRVAFHCDIPSAAELPDVNVGSHRMTQAVLNLLVNAGEAIEGEGEVRLKAAVDADSGHVVLSVSDTGEGMTEEVRRRALDPFYTTKKRGLGTGLGLSLVHGVVQAARGSVNIVSQVGKGTTVSLRIPIPNHGEPRASRRFSKAHAARIATVSVVDPRIASLVTTLLHAAGYEVNEQPAEDPGPPNSHLWIVEGATASFDVAKRYLRGHGRRQILIIGKGGEDVARIGALRIEDPSDFEAMRRAIRNLNDA